MGQSTPKKSTIFIFAYAPAGFGHLRVTDALYQGLSKHEVSYLLGSQDNRIAWLHRFLSIHPITRFLFERMQHGFYGEIFTIIYRWLLIKRSDIIYNQVITLIEQQFNAPQKIVVIATHFGLAHQLGHIKERLLKEQEIRMYLAVQVTDDSPQPIWYIPTADVICVPSYQTRDQLLEYGKRNGFPKVPIEVIPYPLNLSLSEQLSSNHVAYRVNQIDKASASRIHVSIPISGAAVGLSFFETLMEELNIKSNRFLFHVVCKITPFTQRFINALSAKNYVELHTAPTDRKVVNLYEEIYKKEVVISLEITKPSEQSFKALLSPNQKGGVLLLFSTPVGKQEKDNLDFLRRHSLIPKQSFQEKIEHYAKQDIRLATSHTSFLDEISCFRGIEIPKDPKDAAIMIWWCIREGIFTKMMNCHMNKNKKDEHFYELMPNGVSEFWKRVMNLLSD